MLRISQISKRHASNLSIENAGPLMKGLARVVQPDKKEKVSPIQVKGLKRFWEELDVEEVPEGVTVTLGGKSLRTMGQHDLVLPLSKKPLAHLLKHEWAVLPSLKLKNHSVPLTSLCSRAIDIAKSPAVKEAAVKDIMPYIDTDALLIFEPSESYQGRLRAAQEADFRPVIAEAEKFFGVNLNSMDSDKGLLGNRQTPEDKEKVRQWALSLSPWQLAALERATLTSKSFICGAFLISGKLTPTQVAELVGLETKFQVERWGEVEDTHDVDFCDIRRHLASCSLLAKM
ncbi:Protein atp12 [Yarrowia sp. B02]|nr:Protein atp12 [Yarrowia sp. B02]